MCATPHAILLCRGFLDRSDADSAMAPSSSQWAFGELLPAIVIILTCCRISRTLALLTRFDIVY
jgi:hypothetical protein